VIVITFSREFYVSFWSQVVIHSMVFVLEEKDFFISQVTHHFFHIFILSLKFCFYYYIVLSILV